MTSSNGYYLHAKASMDVLFERFKNKTVNDQYPLDTEPPDYKNDMFTVMKMTNQLRLDEGKAYTIDVQPDYRNVFLTLNHHIGRIYSSLDPKTCSYFTPSGLMAYCLSLVYAHALLNDCENIRNPRSQHAHEFYANRSRCDLIHKLQQAFVPDFMANILNALHHGFDERKDTIRFVHSLACYSLKHDYGRSLPISIYLKAHDITASTRSNTEPHDLFEKWIQFNVTAGAQALTVGNIIGAGTPDGDYLSWILNAHNSLFNPVTQRTNTMRPMFSRVHAETYNIPTYAGFNPYIYLLHAHDDAVDVTINFIQSVSSALNSQYTNGKRLDFYNNVEPSNHILTHYYTQATLPTYHTLTLTPTDDVISHTTYAAKVKFAIEGNIRAETRIKAPTDLTPAQAALYLVENKPYDPNSPARPSELYNASLHLRPDIMLFSPFEQKPLSYYFAIICGLSIESSEIDGFSVPIPDIERSLESENSLFFESAIPFSHIWPHTQYGQEGRSFVPRTRAHGEKPSVSITLFDSGEHRFPKVGQNLTIVPAENAQIPGFQPESNHTRCAKAASKTTFKYNFEDDTNTTTCPVEFFYLWSSYRWLNNEHSTHNNAQNTKFMIANFRTIYGTNVTMSQLQHVSLKLQQS